MKRIIVGDVSLSVEDRGSGHVLLFVHGFPLDHTMWRGQLDDLSTDYRVVAPDLRGFGSSDASPGIVTMEQFADDLVSLLDALNIASPVTLCGLSMGGYIAWETWNRHAMRLARLIVCDTRAQLDAPEVARARELMAQQVLQDGVSRVSDDMIPKLFAESTFQIQPDKIAETRRVIERSSPDGVAAAQRGMAVRSGFCDRLYRIELPVLVVCGEHDQISTPAEMKDIANALPSSHFVEVPSAGHMSPLEQPATVNAAIREFMSTCPAA